jgi:hypothetical protein
LKEDEGHERSKPERDYPSRTIFHYIMIAADCQS